MANPSLIRPAAGFILYRNGSDPSNPLFLMLQSRRHGEWGMPKGHADESDADALVTACRELHEETGIREVLVHSNFRTRISYRLPSGATKDVTYFLARLERGEVELSEEHLEFDWVPALEATILLKHESLRDLISAAMSHILPNGAEKSDLL